MNTCHPPNLEIVHITLLVDALPPASRTVPFGWAAIKLRQVWGHGHALGYLVCQAPPDETPRMVLGADALIRPVTAPELSY